MRNVYVVLFGVILPCITLVIEFVGAMCADVFFDPIPTFWHVLLVGFVPLANALAVIGADCRWSRHRNLFLWINGVAIGISLSYGLAFLPITPLAFIAILGMGIGFLPLSPLLSFIAAVWIRKAILAMPIETVDSGEGDVSVKQSGNLRALLMGASLV